MSLWKKTKDLFKRLKGDSPPPVRPDPTPEEPLLPVFIEPLPEYQQRQRDFEARAEAVTVLHSSTNRALGGGGTFNKGRNAAKRRMRVGPRKYWPVLKAVA